MSAGQIAALIAAGAFVVLVGLLAVPLIKLGRTLDEATLAIRKASDEADPLFNGANEPRPSKTTTSPRRTGSVWKSVLETRMRSPPAWTSAAVVSTYLVLRRRLDIET